MLEREKIHVQLGCDYWISTTTKCAETAIVRLTRNSEQQMACATHAAAITRTVGLHREAHHSERTAGTTRPVTSNAPTHVTE